MPSFENLLFDVKDGVAVVSFHRPQALNALNEATLKELRAAILWIEHHAAGREGSPTVDAVILTGSGEKSFVAGADILEMKGKSPQEGEDFARVGQAVTRALELLPQPVIAAVNGFALGGGCEFAMACDFTLASENAVFGQPEVALGIIPGFGGTVRLARYVGLARARELILTGRKIKADEALRIGLVNEVVPQARLLERAHAVAQEIRRNSPLAVARAKKLMNQVESLSVDAGLREEALQFSGLFGSHDQREGMGAFSEKRKPAFKGE
ncbi:MAG: enoyl-CoA hydratase/isomerase family protein [Bdellovibrionales bacterium]|nr:enoyl-CoA hydratase/isomerase family protein [Bdellovibrionales bacterium]